MIEELKQFLMIKYFIPLQVTNDFLHTMVITKNNSGKISGLVYFYFDKSYRLST